jgi:hypothetical protein
LSGLVKHNHIFTCDGDDDELIMTIRKSNLDEHEIIRHTAVRPSRGFINDIKKLCTWSAALLQPIKPPGINPYKWVELFFKYRPVVPPEYHHLKMVKTENVIRIENRAKVKAVKEDKTVGIMTDDDAFGWKKKKVQENKEELKRLGLGAHRKKAELIARLEEHISTVSRAEPSNAEPNNG